MAQNYSIKASVLLSVETATNPPSITLKWQNEADATSYTVFRKLKGASSWGAAKATLPKDSTRYTDLTVEADKAYEYRVNRSATSIPGSGYVYASIGLPAQEWNGSVLLLIDSTVNKQLTAKIATLKEDLANEGWYVLTYVPSTKESVAEIRNKISNFKTIHRDLRSVFILGHIKVPYSGNFNPDAHPDHQGAWPSDTYYADVDGFWTDISVDNNAASRTANRNIPGDGKFDQSNIPSDVELEVGRVDFFDMPALNRSEMDLLGRYLDKNHLWRTGQIQAEKRGIVQDNFNFMNEAFGQSGMKNFSSFFGPSNVQYASYRDSLLKKSYLCSYGSGGGSYTSAGGISNTTMMATDSLQSIFTFIFGSYFGDWDSPNNFLRAALASGTVLTNAWSGRPLWTLHHMALGETIGYSTRISTNNSSTYTAGFSARGTHIALMGDPTLRLHPWNSTGQLQLVESGPNIDLRWNTNSLASHGYTIYRRIEGNTQFDVIARNVKDTIYRDACLLPGFRYEYMVRGVRLETSASGNYYNLSTGIRDTLTKVLSITPTADFSFSKDYEFVHLKSESKNTNNVKWIIGKDTLTGNELDVVLDCTSNNVLICLIAEGACDMDQICKTINYDCSIPKVSKISIDTIRCNGLKGGIEIVDLTGADPFRFKWSTGDTTLRLSNINAGTYKLTITSSRSTDAEYTFDLAEPAPISANYNLRPASPGKNDGGIDNLSISGGTPPYQYRMNTVGRIDSLTAGNYLLSIEDSNGCTHQVNIRIDVKTAVNNTLDGSLCYLFPSPVINQLTLQSDQTLDLSAIELFDALGRKLQSYPIKATEFDVVAIKPGIYSLKLTSISGGQLTLKFEKM